MIKIMRGASMFKRAFFCFALGSVSIAAAAEVPGDLTYVHCSEPGADFRLSELNRTVSYFSDKHQAYRPVCRDCEITEWGNNIVMKDGPMTVVQIDRMIGRIWVRGTEAKPVAGAFSTRTFQRSCVRGAPAVPRRKPVETARAF
jgi:hypothetical protein